MASLEADLALPRARGILRALAREVHSWSVTLRIGLALLALVVVLAAFAPLIAPFDPNYQDFDAILMPPGFTHLFGTDNLGRDIFSRVLYGGRIDMVAAFFMTYVPLFYGVMIGAYAGFRGGWVDAVVNTLVNIAIAFPFLILIIVAVAVLGPGMQNIYISVFLLAWTMYARLARAEMLVERGKDYMLAARILGFPTRRILLRHAMPNIIGSSIVFSMSDFVLNILLLSSLSFIGLGIQPPTPEWGAMIADGKDFILQSWWICTMPGLAVVVAGSALSLIGDGLARRLGDRHTGAA
jgi:peptide/nickel transport system permease protein